MVVYLPGFIASQTNEPEIMMEANYYSALNVVRSLIEISIEKSGQSPKKHSINDGNISIHNDEKLPKIQYADDWNKSIIDEEKSPKAQSNDDSDKSLINEDMLEKERVISGIPNTSGLPSRIVFVGSVMSILSFIGFSGYAGIFCTTFNYIASKYAIKGFSDAMRSELKPLGVKVHLYMPGNMSTPGFENENLTKPLITAQIEGDSQTISPKEAARFLLSSLMNERYYISNDILGELARISVNGGG